MAELDEELSADTVRFQAFGARADQDTPPPWHMRASASRIGLLAAGVVVVAVVLALVMMTLT
jgi:hypothetical protein